MELDLYTSDLQPCEQSRFLLIYDQNQVSAAATMLCVLTSSTPFSLLSPPILRHF